MDTATAATIESLKQQLDAARQELSDRDNEDDRSDSLVNSIIAACAGSGCLNAHELRVALDAARADCATLYTAKAKLIDELDSTRADVWNLTETVESLRNSIAASQAREAAYRADVVRLTAELQGERDDLAAMHTILRQSQSLCGDWHMAVMLAVPHGTVWDAGNPKAMVQTIIDREAAARADVVRFTADADELRRGYAFVASENARLLNDVGVIGNRAAMDSEDAERKLARERSRADVLAAEVRAYRVWQRTKCDDNASSLEHWHACKALDEATWNTDRTHALDPAKFEVKP